MGPSQPLLHHRQLEQRAHRVGVADVLVRALLHQLDDGHAQGLEAGARLGWHGAGGCGVGVVLTAAVALLVVTQRRGVVVTGHSHLDAQ